MSSSGESSSFFRNNGRPRPPLTEEERQEYRLLKREAMLIEREMKLKQKEKELEALRASYHAELAALRSHSCQPENAQEFSESAVLELIKEALNQKNNNNFYGLLKKISNELRKFVNDCPIPHKTEEFSKLLHELREEILRRHPYIEQKSPVPQSILKNSDSTYNDVANVTLNECSASRESFSAKDLSHIPIDKKSDVNSDYQYDISLHSESTFKLMDEYTPDEEGISMSSLPEGALQNGFNSHSLASSTPGAQNKGSRDCTQISDISSNETPKDELTTPPKLIRSNSYTLESPSPSLLAYMRNFTLESSKEPKSNISLNERNDPSSSKPVVRNLNNLWAEKESGQRKHLDEISPDCRDSLEDGEEQYTPESEQNSLHGNIPLQKNLSDSAVITSYHEHKLAQSIHERNLSRSASSSQSFHGPSSAKNKENCNLSQRFLAGNMNQSFHAGNMNQSIHADNMNQSFHLITGSISSNHKIPSKPTSLAINSISQIFLQSSFGQSMQREYLDEDLIRVSSGKRPSLENASQNLSQHISDKEGNSGIGSEQNCVQNSLVNSEHKDFHNVSSERFPEAEISNTSLQRNYSKTLTQSLYEGDISNADSSMLMNQSINMVLNNGLDESSQKLIPNREDEEIRNKKQKAAITLQSYARGYFVRRLMKTQKVEQIKNTIKDAVVCAIGLYAEQAVTPGDLDLHARLMQQVTAACYELHSIFILWSTSQRMALIRADRERLKNPPPKLHQSTRGRRRNDSGSAMSRSVSSVRSNSFKKTHKRTKSSDIEIKRPATMPSTPKSSPLSYKPWG